MNEKDNAPVVTHERLTMMEVERQAIYARIANLEQQEKELTKTIETLRRVIAQDYVARFDDSTYADVVEIDGRKVLSLGSPHHETRSEIRDMIASVLNAETKGLRYRITELNYAVVCALSDLQAEEYSAAMDTLNKAWEYVSLPEHHRKNVELQNQVTALKETMRDVYLHLTFGDDAPQSKIQNAIEELTAHITQQT